MLYVCRRQRVYRVVLFICFAGVVFLCFQFFLFGALNSDNSSQSNNNDINSFNSGPQQLQAERLAAGGKHGGLHVKRAELAECNASNCSRIDSGLDNVQDIEQLIQENKILRRQKEEKRRGGTVNSSKDIPVHVAKIPSLKDDVAGHLDKKSQTFSDVWHLLEFTASRQIGSVNTIPVNFTRGVNSRWQHLYVPDDHGMFTCFLSQEKILFERVNDDYCDCLDSSDEPGTSACSTGRFYCTFQLTAVAENPRWLPSSRVNDGICDCCDGSDEFMNQTLPHHIAVTDGMAHYGIYQSPCVDRCQELRRRQAEIDNVRLRGRVIKEDYIKAGAAHVNDTEIYGPGAVFYKLYEFCRDVKISKYVYSVCPLRQVKQTDNGQSVVIGRQVRWIDKGPAVFKLVLGDGDNKNCPESKPRQSIVEFECGVEDHVASISESEVCHYVVHFITPAAC